MPEAQVDRFMLKVVIDYPSREEELAILERMGPVEPHLDVRPVMSAEDLAALRQVVDATYVDEKVKGYLVDLVRATRKPEEYGLEMTGLIQYGGSPRAVIALVRAARAQAFLEGRGYVTPQDVKSAAPDVLRHRLLVSYEAEAEERKAEDLLKQILDKLPVP